MHSNKSYLLSLFMVIQPWTLTFNMLTPDSCRVWDVSPVFLKFLSESHTLTLWWSSNWDIHSCEDMWMSWRFPLVPFHCRMMNLKLFENGLITLPRLIGNFSKLIVDIFPLWHFVHPDQYKISFFIYRCSHLLVISHWSAFDQQHLATSRYKGALSYSHDCLEYMV